VRYFLVLFLLTSTPCYAAQIALDHFTEASDTDLADHISDSPGANPSWVQSGGGMVVEADEDEYRGNTSTKRYARHTADVGDDDMDITAEVKSTVESTRAMGVGGRIPSGEDGSSNAYYCFLVGDDGTGVDLEMEKVVAGSTTSLGTNDFNGTEGTFYTTVLKLRTASQVCSLDAVDKITTTDSDLTGGQFGGIRAVRNDDNNRLDDFLLESVSAGGATRRVFIT